MVSRSCASLQALGRAPEELAAPIVLRLAELAVMRDHATADWRDVVSRLRVPSLFISGRDGEYWPCEHAAAAAGLNPRATFEVINDCGHAASLERPEEFNALMLRLLDKIA